MTLHGGPTTVFKLGSLPEAARLATAISDLPGRGARSILTAARDRLNMKLTRELWATEMEDVDTARAISTVSGEMGASCHAHQQAEPVARAAHEYLWGCF